MSGQQPKGSSANNHFHKAFKVHRKPPFITRETFVERRYKTMSQAVSTDGLSVNSGGGSAPPSSVQRIPRGRSPGALYGASYFDAQKPSSSKRNLEDLDQSNSDPKKQDVKDTPEKKFPEQPNSSENEEGEMGNLSQAEIAAQAIEASSASPNKGDYASVANGKKEYKYLLYLQKSLERREAINLKQFEAFMEYFMSILDNMEPDQLCRVQLDWHAYNHGRGLLACANEETAMFIKDITSGFTFEKAQFKCWTKEEFGDRHIYKCLLHGKVWCRRSPFETMKFIFTKVNNIKEGTWRVTKYFKNTHRRGRETVFVIFEADETFHSQLSKLFGTCTTKNEVTINVGAGNTTLEYKLSKGGQCDIEDSNDKDSADSGVTSEVRNVSGLHKI